MSDKQIDAVIHAIAEATRPRPRAETPPWFIPDGEPITIDVPACGVDAALPDGPATLVVNAGEAAASVSTLSNLPEGMGVTIRPGDHAVFSRFSGETRLRASSERGTTLKIFGGSLAEPGVDQTSAELPQ